MPSVRRTSSHSIHPRCSSASRPRVSAPASGRNKAWGLRGSRGQIPCSPSPGLRPQRCVRMPVMHSRSAGLDHDLGGEDDQADGRGCGDDAAGAAECGARRARQEPVGVRQRPGGAGRAAAVQPGADPGRQARAPAEVRRALVPQLRPAAPRRRPGGRAGLPRRAQAMGVPAFRQKYRTRHARALHPAEDRLGAPDGRDHRRRRQALTEEVAAPLARSASASPACAARRWWCDGLLTAPRRSWGTSSPCAKRARARHHAQTTPPARSPRRAPRPPPTAPSCQSRPAPPAKQPRPRPPSPHPASARPPSAPPHAAPTHSNHPNPRYALQPTPPHIITPTSSRELDGQPKTKHEASTTLSPWASLQPRPRSRLGRRSRVSHGALVLSLRPEKRASSGQRPRRRRAPARGYVLT